MPLIARRGDDLVAGYTLDEKSWSDLARENRSAPVLRAVCCESHVVCKTSRLGTRFFAHRAEATCEYRGESEQHLQAKVAAANAGARAGWNAHVECADRDAGWRADVLFEKGGRRRVVEIQTSHISAEDLERRQIRYRAAGIEAWWLVRSAKGLRSTEKTPLVELTPPDEPAADMRVRLPGTSDTLQLAHFVELLLGDSVQWSPWAGKEIPIDILTAKRRCPSGLHVHRYIVGGVLRVSALWPGAPDRDLSWYSLSSGSRGHEFGNLVNAFPFEKDRVARPQGFSGRNGYQLLQPCPACIRGLREPFAIKIGDDARVWRRARVKASPAWAGESPRSSDDGYPSCWWWPRPDR